MKNLDTNLNKLKSNRNNILKYLEITCDTLQFYCKIEFVDKH